MLKELMKERKILLTDMMVISSNSLKVRWAYYPISHMSNSVYVTFGNTMNIVCVYKKV